MVGLVGEARPDQGMLARIEAELDQLPEPKPLNTFEAGKRDGKILLIGLIAGSLLFFAGHFVVNTMIRDQLEIKFRPDTGAAWVALGSVNLEGPSLQAFVAAKCENQTHLIIDLRGLDAFPEDGANSTSGIQNSITLMKREEKILMECIHLDAGIR